MITDFLLGAILWLVNGLLSFLPLATLDSRLAAQVLAVTNAIALWNTILPLDTLFTCVTILFVVEAVVITFKILNFVRKMIPTQS